MRRFRISRTVARVFAVLLLAGVISHTAADWIAAQSSAHGVAATDSTSHGDGMPDYEASIVVCWFVAFTGALLALFYARTFFSWVIGQDEGDARMIKIAHNVRDGANAYLMQQYRIVAIFFIVPADCVRFLIFFMQLYLRTANRTLQVSTLFQGPYAGIVH